MKIEDEKRKLLLRLKDAKNQTWKKAHFNLPESEFLNLFLIYFLLENVALCRSAPEIKTKYHLN